MKTFSGGDTEKSTYCKQNLGENLRLCTFFVRAMRRPFEPGSSREGTRESSASRWPSAQRLETLTSPLGYRNIARRRGGGVSSVEEHLPYTQGVVGSNPSPPTSYRLIVPAVADIAGS